MSDGDDPIFDIPVASPAPPAAAAAGGPKWDISEPQPLTPEACRDDLARTCDAGEMRMVDALWAGLVLRYESVAAHHRAEAAALGGALVEVERRLNVERARAERAEAALQRVVPWLELKLKKLCASSTDIELWVSSCKRMLSGGDQ